MKAQVILYRSVSSASERGVSLIFALIALVAMSLAALALVRTVDTATLVAGNLAFRQAATTSADSGVETAITALAAIQASAPTENIYIVDPLLTHPLNRTFDPPNGYYSSLDQGGNYSVVARPPYTTPIGLYSPAAWVDGVSSPEVLDANTGNRARYIIQRMCRLPDTFLSPKNCLMTGAKKDNSGKEVLLPSAICEGPGCPKGGQSPVYRVTVRVTGPKNTVSYVQALVH